MHTGSEGIKVDPSSKHFAKRLNKNAIKPHKGAPSPKNVHNPCIPSLPKFGKKLMDPHFCLFSARNQFLSGGGPSLTILNGKLIKNVATVTLQTRLVIIRKFHKTIVSSDSMSLCFYVSLSLCISVSDPISPKPNLTLNMPAY